jgi:uncharacterized protein YceK
MPTIIRAVALAVAVSLLAGCSATTTLSSAQGGTTIQVKGSAATDSPRTETYSTTSFGNYEFRAESPGYEPLTGILPLKFNGGYLAADILFFAPAMFFNLREVFPYYEVDLEARVIRYRQKPDQPWTEYSPTAAESDRGAAHFTDR